MSKKYAYKALSNGTLSNPYRFVQQDEVVYFDEPYKAKWLMPLDEANQRKVEPVMPHMNVVSAQSVNGMNGVDALKNRPASDQNSTEQFKQNLSAIIQREQKEDAASAANKIGQQIPPSTPRVNSAGAAPVVPVVPQNVEANKQPGGEAAPQEGTGNQSVI